MVADQPRYRKAAQDQQGDLGQQDQLVELSTLRLTDFVGFIWSHLIKPRWDMLPGKRPNRAVTPTLLQMEAVECGAVALGIVLRYYGCYVSLEALRLACGVSRDGSNALNILRAARHYGLEARGVQRHTITDLTLLPLPLIMHWNFNHFVVLEGVDGENIFINDPETGPRAITLDEFDAAFTGVALVFQPGSEFVKTGKSFSLFSALRQRLEGMERTLFFVCLASLFLLIPGFLIPTFLKVFVDEILVQRQGFILPLLAGMGLMLVLRAALTWIQQDYLLRLETRIAVRTSSQFFRHILRLPLEFFTQRHAGDIAYRVQSNDHIAQLLSGELATAVINLVMIAFYGILLLQYDVPLTMISMTFVLLALLCLRWVSRLRTDANRRLLHERGKLMGSMMNGLRSIETLKALGAENRFFAELTGLNARIINIEQRLGYVTYGLSVVPVFLLSLNAAVVLIIGGEYVVSGQMSIGTLVAFQSLILSFTHPTRQLVDLGSRVQEAAGHMSRLEDVLLHDADPVVLNHEPVGESAGLEGYLTLQDVSFGYNPLKAPFITGFDLNLVPGQWVAVVGRSGSGKSTIAKLVTGLYQRWGGEIQYDGRCRNEIPISVMSSSVAFVDQNITLFAGSVRNNLTLWDNNISDEDMIRAAQDACIHDRIMMLPGGYDAVLEENGRNLSGGERQRLEIARALGKNPQVLILDEATSALDSHLEQIIQQHLRARGCTCLMIAHRLSTIRTCDEIIVMEQGSIIQRGTHEQLIQQAGLYAELFGFEGQCDAHTA